MEDTFGKQLLIQFSLIMGTLIFGIYLSVTFLIVDKDSPTLSFTLGYALYSLVPAVRLVYVATSVGKVINKVEEVIRKRGRAHFPNSIILWQTFKACSNSRSRNTLSKNPGQGALVRDGVPDSVL